MRLSQEQNQKMQEALLQNIYRRRRRESVLPSRFDSETDPVATVSSEYKVPKGNRGMFDPYSQGSGDRGVSMEAVPGEAGAHARVRAGASGDRNLDKPDPRSRDGQREIGPRDSYESEYVGDVCTGRFSKPQRRSSGYETDLDQEARRRQDTIQETQRVSFLIDPLKMADNEERLEQVSTQVQKQQEWTQETLR
jgi:hypothetical protein